MRKTLTTIATAAAAITASTGFAVAAQASTTVTTGACTTGVLGAYCGTQQDGNGLNVTAASTSYNQAVDASTVSGSPVDDFAWFVPAGSFPAQSKQVMITPSGKLTGLCLSDPDQVYAGHPNAHAIVQRTCSGDNKFQTWTYNGTGWTNAATGLVLTSNGAGKQLTDAAAVAGSATQTWTFQS